MSRSVKFWRHAVSYFSRPCESLRGGAARGGRGRIVFSHLEPPLDIRFAPNEARVIGCLMEKSVITPDQYPLSLNALVNACNQKSSREPVLNLDQGTVQRAVNELVAKKHVMVENLGSRVDKYRQRFCNTQFALIQFSPAEYAVICLLLLRGLQKIGRAHV